MATILVVEDDRDMCNLIRSHLEAEGHRVPAADRKPAEYEPNNRDQQEQKPDAGQLRVMTMGRIVLGRHGR